MPVLLSFAVYSNWMDGYQASFRRILVDSGAYSELNSGKVIDPHKYRDFAQRFEPHADAIAGIDDIRGDYNRSLSNYSKWGGFPTIHDSDPIEILSELIAISREQGRRWLGIGLMPPREGKERFIRDVCEQVPDDIHIHGWALRRYSHVRRLDSMDSTNWWRDAMDIRKALPWLTYGETLEIVVKRYQRETRIFKDSKASPQLEMNL